MEYRITDSPTINYESLVVTLEWMLKNQREELLRLLDKSNPFSGYSNKESLQSSHTGNLLSFFQAGNEMRKVNEIGGDSLLTFNFGSRKLVANGKLLKWYPNRDIDSTIPSWLRYAHAEIGTAEIKGLVHNLRIVEYQSVTSFKAKDDEEAWCGAFVGWCIKKAGLPLPKIPERAKSWKNWTSGMEISQPAYGCLVVLERTGGGHVGFAVGRDENKKLLLLGGNQGDKVSIRPTNGHVLDYVWPNDKPVSKFDKLLTRMDTTVGGNSYR